VQSQLLAILFTLMSAPFSSVQHPDNDHAIYLSLVEVDHKNLGGTATIKIKVFTDDMEDAILNTFKKRFHFLDTSDCEGIQSEIETYFAAHLSYSINDKSTSLALSHCELNGDAVWFHFDIECPDQWDKVDVKADFLMELFPTQSNIITIYHGQEKRFLRITNSNLEETTTF